MKVGILGAGRLGLVLARRFAEAGNEVVVSFTRNPARLASWAAAAHPNIRVVAPADVASSSDVVALATSWHAVPLALNDVGSLANAKLWFASLPPPPSDPAWWVSGAASGAQLVANLCKASSFVAGPPPPAGVLEKLGPATSTRPSLFFCGDDEAKTVVEPLFDALFVESVDCGSLEAARDIEACSFLAERIARRRLDARVAFRLLDFS